MEESARAAGALVVDAQCVSGVLGRFQLSWETETPNVLPLTGWGKVLSFIYLLFGVWIPLIFVGLVLRILLTTGDFYGWSIFRYSRYYDFTYLSRENVGLALYLLFIFLLVPVANWGVWRTIIYKMTDRKKAVEWLGGVAAVMSFVAMGIGFIFWNQLNFVQLVIVLIPLTAFAVLVRYSIYFTERLGTPLIYWKGIILGVILLLLPFGVTLGIRSIQLAPALSTSHGLRLMEVLLWEGASRGPLADRLTELVSPSYSHNQVIFSTETVKKGTERAPLWTRETVARLWAAQEIGRDLGSDKRDRVELLTRTYSILHRDSAAVALETTPKWDAGQDPEWIGRAAFERKSDLMPMVRNSARVAISEPLTRRGSAMDRLKSVSLESSREVRSRTEGFELGSLASKASGFGSQRKSIVVVFRPWLILLLFLTPLVVAVLYFRSRRRVIRPVFRLSDQ